MDIVALVDRISPLGFKFNFSSKQEEERAKQLEEAVERDEEEASEKDSNDEPEVKTFKIKGKRTNKN